MRLRWAEARRHNNCERVKTLRVVLQGSRQTDGQQTAPPHPPPPSVPSRLESCSAARTLPDARGRPVCDISAPDSCFVPLWDGFVHESETGRLLNDGLLSSSLPGRVLTSCCCGGPPPPTFLNLVDSDTTKSRMQGIYLHPLIHYDWEKKTWVCVVKG